VSIRSQTAYLGLGFRVQAFETQALKEAGLGSERDSRRPEQATCSPTACLGAYETQALKEVLKRQASRRPEQATCLAVRLPV
jgi:hypothetical protein